MLKFIEVTNQKTPLRPYKNDENVLNDISNVANAALLIPKDIVVIDFDGDNLGKDGSIYDDIIIKYLIDTYKPYWVRSQQNHCHLYFKVPKGVKIKKDADIVSLGGVIIDYLAEHTLSIIKMNGILREAESPLTEERLSNLPELPPILYPLYGYKKDTLPTFCGMVEKDGRDNAIYKFVNDIDRINKKNKLNYNLAVVKEALMFIDNHLFKDPLGENIIDIKVDRNFSKIIDKDNNEDDDTPLVIKKFSDIEQEETKWIWQPYIPLGCLVALVGDPGLGKSTFAIKVASLLSNGSVFPYSLSQLPPSVVIFQNGEDNPSTTTKKRLLAAGANLDNIIMIDEESSPFNLKRVKSLEKILKETKCKLMVIDPIQSYMPSKTNSNDRSDVRKALNPIKDLARKYQCTILIVMHNNKSESSKAINRAAGSGDFMAITRSVLSITEDDNRKRYINHIKSSLDTKGKTIEYKINKEGKVEFIRQVDQLEIKERPIEKAKKFIEAYMCDENEVKSKDIKEAATNERISMDTLRRAKETLGIASEQRRENGISIWYWVRKIPPIHAEIEGSMITEYGSSPYGSELDKSINDNTDEYNCIDISNNAEGDT